MRRVGVAAERAQLGGCRVQLRDDMVITLLPTELHARAIDLLDRAAFTHERVDGHQGRAHRRLREAEVVRARDFERLPERVQGLRGVTAAGPHIHESTFGPAQGGDVGVLLLKRERS